MRSRLSVICKSSAVLLALLGIILSLIQAEEHGYSHAGKRLLYFTAQSNIWILLLFALLLILPFCKTYTQNKRLDYVLYSLKFVFTVSITITAFIFCVVLAPGAKEANYDAFSLSSILTHMAVPVLAVVDLFLDPHKITLNKHHLLYTIIPPLLYCVFASILGAFHVDFGRGDTYPYFFLNYKSPAGFFGFSREMPYIIGSFYWILVILGMILGIGALYKHFCQKHSPSAQVE